jgi:hypothetical protein
MVEFERKLNIGHLLTVVSVLISIAALLVSRSKDQQLYAREQADRVRSAAGNALAGLERSSELAASLFDDLQPMFVRASERMASRAKPAVVRDLVWQETNAARAAVMRKMLDDNPQQAYVALYGYHPSLRDLVKAVTRQLEGRDDKVFSEFIAALEGEVLARRVDGPDETAIAGNAMRGLARHFQRCLAATRERTAAPLEQFLSALVLSSDDEILLGKNAGGPVMARLDAAVAATEKSGGAPSDARCGPVPE